MTRVAYRLLRRLIERPHADETEDDVSLDPGKRRSTGQRYDVSLDFGSTVLCS